MALRKKIYYPENQIQKGLFTNGKEWMILDDWSEYIGYYHYYSSTREVFTEKEWHPKKSKPLTPYIEKEPSYFKYIDLANYGRDYLGQKYKKFGPVVYNVYTAPRATVRKLTSVEEEEGVMIRHFIFKRNELTKKPIEIDNLQAQSYNKSREGINQALYRMVDVPWKIDGPEFDVIEDGILKIPGIYNTNKRIVERYSKNFPILKSILTNFVEFSRYNV